MKILDRFRLWRLRRLPKVQRHIEGTHLGVARTAVLLYKHGGTEKSETISHWVEQLQQSGGESLRVIPMAYWHRTKEERKKAHQSGEKPHTTAKTPFDLRPQPWWHFDDSAISSWRRPKSVELRRFINTDYDLLLYCETAPCWVLEEVLARSKARMKIGPSGLERSMDLDIILATTPPTSFDSHLQGMFDFLTQAPLQSSHR